MESVLFPVFAHDSSSYAPKPVGRLPAPGYGLQRFANLGLADSTGKVSSLGARNSIAINFASCVELCQGLREP